VKAPTDCPFLFYLDVRVSPRACFFPPSKILQPAVSALDSGGARHSVPRAHRSRCFCPLLPFWGGPRAVKPGITVPSSVVSLAMAAGCFLVKAGRLVFFALPPVPFFLALVPATFWRYPGLNYHGPFNLEGLICPPFFFLFSRLFFPLRARTKSARPPFFPPNMSFLLVVAEIRRDARYLIFRLGGEGFNPFLVSRFSQVIVFRG